MKNKVTRYATLAGMANFMGGYCCMYFMPAFYQQVYPGFKLAFANMNALSLASMGFCSALIGGIISDKYTKKYPMTNAYIGIFGSILVIPCDIMAFTTTGNFWLSICFLAAKYLAGECWGSPQLSMM
jgi:sugar phosphate permease